MRRFCLIFISACMLAACEKGADPGMATSTFTARVNGKTVKAEEIYWYTLNSELHIQAKLDYKIFSITLNDYKGPGNYVFARTVGSASFKERNDTYTSNSGSAVILNDNAKALKGKFNFSAVNGNSTVQIEEGSFMLVKP